MKKHTALLLCGVSAMALLLSGCLPAVLVTRSAPDGDQEIADQWEDAARDLEDHINSLDDDWSAKSHYWQVLDAEGQEVRIIDAEEAVRQVDDLVQGDMEWERASDAEDGTVLYTYVFMQQKTLLAGQDPDAEREHEEVLRLTVCQDTDILSITVLEGLDGRFPSSLVDLEDLLTFHVQAPAETAEALRDPAQFA